MQTLNHLISIDLDRQFDSAYLDRTVNYYETIIAEGDDRSCNYWNLGVAYLLQERELDAQVTWFVPFELASELKTIALTNELSIVLDRVASQKLSANNLDDAWLISQYLREVDATHIDNLLRSILIEIKLDRFTPEILTHWQAIEIISNPTDISVDRELLAQVLESLCYFPSLFVSKFIHQCLLSFLEHQAHSILTLGKTALLIVHPSNHNQFIFEILNICQSLQPTNQVILGIICDIYCIYGKYREAINFSSLMYDVSDTLTSKIVASYTRIRTLLSAGDWKTAVPLLYRHSQLLETFLNERPDILELSTNQGVLVSAVLLSCVADKPDYFRSIQNQISLIYLEHNRTQIVDKQIKPASIQKQADIIRIGYLGSTLRSHSVGWLSRWLWQFHDRTRFQIFTYCINQNAEDRFYRQWFRDRSDVSYCFGSNADEIAAQIYADEVDILIDLDSLTLSTTCKILAAKPAPIQVSWLGWDATGLPTVDYFIADRYVLPDNAQDYYQEKIWRLPQSYLAVNGFEVGTPTISRKDLDIPSDAIIYWSGQRGHKRHPDTVRAQLRIVKAVPNSYFLIKGDTDPTIIEEFFGQIATEEGIDFSRLRFLGSVADEYTHRANLAIADIVLDTFPYNGATTTLETLWMGIPMVTQVGQQFAARNSYTFMINAGITEGIAWNEEEYVDWGVKLGLDRDLRMQVREKLRSGRHSAPVWNAKQFTLDMEQAYREMWAKHLEQIDLNSIDPHEHN
jgi:predicted O-linked N-acetylglucosamine transferase (SPINDLY family)